MSEHRSLVWKVQAAIYSGETLLLVGLFALAAAGSPEFTLGPLARVWVAATLPLPCHLAWQAHFLWVTRQSRRRIAPPVGAWQPVPQILPA
jgi:hypothetical protein